MKDGDVGGDVFCIFSTWEQMALGRMCMHLQNAMSFHSFCFSAIPFWVFQFFHWNEITNWAIWLANVLDISLYFPVSQANFAGEKSRLNGKLGVAGWL